MATINSYDYPYDPTGQAASNKIVNEIHPLMAAAFRDYHVVIPDFAPFFVDSLEWTFRDLDGTVRTLVEGIDYYYSYPFVGATRGTAKPVAGAIQFLNSSLAGTVTLKKYQTIGGPYTLTLQKINQILADRLENPRITSWEQVTGLPNVFPVVDHEWDLVDMVGMSAVNDSLRAIDASLRQQGQGGLQDHINDHNNPHIVTKDQVQLSLVRNLFTATQAQAEAATSDDAYMTPLSTFWQMKKYAIDPLAAHAANPNAHNMVPSDIGAYTKAEVDTLLAQKLNSGDAAYDSQRLGGRTYTEVRDLILQGTAANSILFNGMTQGDYAAQVLTGTAANAQKFDSKTWQQVLAELDTRYIGGNGSTYQALFQYNGSTGTAMWMKLADVKLTDTANAYTPPNDVEWLVAGLNANGFNRSTTVKLSFYVMDSANLSMYVSSTDNLTPNATFGWTVSSDGKTASIWVKTTIDRQSISVLELSKGTSTFGDGSSSNSVEPAGITYAPQVDLLVTGTMLEAVIDSMTQAISALTA